MKKSKSLLKTILVLPLVVGLVFSWLVTFPSPVFSQTASLVATVSINPLKVKVTAPSSVKVGQWFTITVEASNRGPKTIQKTVAALTTPTEITVRGKIKKLGNLGPQETKTVSWQAKANSSGIFIILAEVTGDLAGEEISATDTTQISANSTSRFSLISLFHRLIFRS